MKKLVAEFIGTSWLVIGGCGSAIFAAGIPEVGIGFMGVSLAFGLTVVTMAYAIGPISGCHLNPAVSLGLAMGGRFSFSELPGYIASQVLGAIFGAFVLYVIFTNGGNDVGGFAANGYGALSPQNYNFFAAVLTEIVMTFFFLFVILGVTAKNAAPQMAGLAIGLCLTLIHLISIPVTNTSVNPARSTSQAIFAGSEYLMQLPVFWIAPFIGAALAGIVWKSFMSHDK